MKPEHRELLDELRPARRVLVVDDHPSFRRCARALLAAEGFEVVGEAEDGAAALELATRVAPEIVLLDVQLPDVDGFEVSSRLLAKNPALKVVLVSSRDRSAYGPRIEASGARGFVAKGELSGPALERLLE
ncbi:MAG TPA: response regulator transcription factor [Gaiellaceae bacterium]|nr:response regulator transcription factor [Gaiellaceae bacterium]